MPLPSSKNQQRESPASPPAINNTLQDIALTFPNTRKLLQMHYIRCSPHKIQNLLPEELEPAIEQKVDADIMLEIKLATIFKRNDDSSWPLSPPRKMNGWELIERLAPQYDQRSPENSVSERERVGNKCYFWNVAQDLDLESMYQDPKSEECTLKSGVVVQEKEKRSEKNGSIALGERVKLCHWVTKARIGLENVGL